MTDGRIISQDCGVTELPVSTPVQMCTLPPPGGNCFPQLLMSLHRIQTTDGEVSVTGSDQLTLPMPGVEETEVSMAAAAPEPGATATPGPTAEESEAKPLEELRIATEAIVALKAQREEMQARQKGPDSRRPVGLCTS